MRITVNDVKHVAELARLELNEAETQQFSEQLNGILQYVHKLNELDTDHVVPTTHVMQLTNVMRSDTVRPSLPLESVFLNAPDEEDGQFQVPAILE